MFVYLCVCVRVLVSQSVMAVSHVMDAGVRRTGTHSEIENPVVLSRHYEEKVKVYIFF